MDASVLNNTLLDIDRLLIIRQCMENVRRQNLPGAAAELGVYRGGVSKFIATELPDRTFYAFENFTGLVNAQPGVDRHTNGNFKDVDYAAVAALLNNTNVVMRRGEFPETVADLQKEKYALVHIDVDTYQSTRDGLEYFYSRLVPGGFLILDGYKYPQCVGSDRAIDEFFADKPETIETPVKYQGVVTKSPSATQFLRIWFDHGLGDCVHFSQTLQLHRRRNYIVSVHFHQNKSELWRAAGFPFTEVHGAPHHRFIYPSGFNQPSQNSEHAGNKTAGNLLLAPLPPLPESVSALWSELTEVDERRRVATHLGSAPRDKMARLLTGLPRPIVCIHSNGTNWPGSKNIAPDTARALYRTLLEQSQASLVLLDWDGRVPPPPPSCRVRHLRRDFGHISTGELLTLLQLSDLLVGIDSGPLHAALITDVPVLGVFHHFYPACITLPNPRAAFMTRSAASYQPVNQARRKQWSILEYAGDQPTAQEISRHALRFLRGPLYFSRDRIGRDIMMQQFVRDWLKRAPPSVEFADRNHTFDWVLQETSVRFAAPNIVETGCQRSREDWTAGCSTYLLGCYLDGRGAGHLHSVDVSAHNLATAAACCQPWNDRITYHVSDSVRWLAEYRQPIDVLYLDSLDADHPETAAHGLREFQAALPKLHERSIVIIDDTVWSGDISQSLSGKYQGKAGSVVSEALASGWRVAACGYQIVLTRSPQEHR